MTTNGHTRTDYERILAEGRDPRGVQPRERGVRCVCGHETWNLIAICDTCMGRKQ